MGITIVNLNNISTSQMKVWLRDITREKIIIDYHPTLRAKQRCYSKETLYEYLVERKFKKIEKKKREGVCRFELYYDHKDKSISGDVIIVIIPRDSVARIIKVVTVIID